MMGTALAEATEATRISKEGEARRRKKKVGRPRTAISQKQKKKLMQQKKNLLQLRPFCDHLPPLRPQIVMEDDLDVISRLTDDFRTCSHRELLDESHSTHESPDTGGTSDPQDAAARYTSSRQHASSSSFGTGSSSKRSRSNKLFTFQRNFGGGVLRETTIQANRNPEDEETMAAVVKRLQKSAGSQVLTFTTEDVKAISEGTKKVIFSMKQLNNVTFAKEEFGKLTADEVLELTNERPVLIELMAEDVIDGEELEIF
jgi:hypothetical protein